jgi:hypothetical protein
MNTGASHLVGLWAEYETWLGFVLLLPGDNAKLSTNIIMNYFPRADTNNYIANPTHPLAHWPAGPLRAARTPAVTWATELSFNEPRLSASCVAQLSPHSRGSISTYKARATRIRYTGAKRRIAPPSL